MHPNNNGYLDLWYDKYGHELHAVAGAKGEATRTLHGAFLAALAQSLRQAGIKFYGCGRSSRTCKQFLSQF